MQIRRSVPTGSLALLLLAAAGCGKIPDQAGDGDGGGGVIDAGTPDARPPGPATVRVLDAAKRPIEGAMVIFADPSGAVLPGGEQNTGPTGEATATISSGDSIWVVIPGDRGARTVFTVLSAEPDDVIVFGPERADPTEFRNITVAPPLSGQPPGTSVELVTGCQTMGVGGSAPPYMMQVNESCGVGGRYPFAFVAYNGEGEAVGFARGEAAEGTVSQAGAWESAFKHVAIAYANPITNADGSALPGGGIQWSEYFRLGRNELLRGGLEVAPAPTNDVEYDQPKFTGVFGRVVLAVFASQLSGETNQVAGRFVSFAGEDVPDVVGFDGSEFLPFVTGASFDPVANTLTWSENLRGGTRENLSQGDFLEFWVRYVDSDEGQVSWWIVMPTTKTSPVEVGVPQAVITLDAPAGLALPAITIVGSFDTQDWDDFRNNIPLPYFPEGSVLPPGEAGMHIAIDFQNAN